MIEQLEVVKVEHPSEPEPELTSLFSEIIENILEAVVEISSSVIVSKTPKSKPKIHFLFQVWEKLRPVSLIKEAHEKLQWF